MTKKKLLYIVLILIIIVPILFFYISFNGNPISKRIAENTVNNLLEENYPDKNYTLKSIGYNFKFNNYVFEYTRRLEDKAWTYDIEVGQSLNPVNVEIWGLNYNSMDDNLSEKISQDASDYIYKLLGEDYSEADIYYPFEIPRDLFAADTEWSPDFQIELMPNIYVTIPFKNESKEEFLQKARFIQQTLKKEGIGYREAQITSVHIETVEGVENHHQKYFIKFTENGDIKVNEIQ